MLQILLTIFEAIKNVKANISNIFKCKTSCCNRIIIVNNKRFLKCNSFGDIYNRWNKQITPAVESPSRRREGDKPDPSSG